MGWQGLIRAFKERPLFVVFPMLMRTATVPDIPAIMRLISRVVPLMQAEGCPVGVIDVTA